MGLIDLILNRPGGFSGEIILAEFAQFQIDGYRNTTFLLRNSPCNFNEWARYEWRLPASGCLFYLAYPIIRSPYSNRLIDLKNGIYDGGYEGRFDLS